MNASRRVLVVGGGGREHALAWKLARDGAEVLVYAADVSDERKMHELVAAARARFGRIDGVISLDRLGLEKVYVQAKRWQGTVGRPEIQSFYGALAGQRANKGVFITTSSFSAQAIEFAKSVERIVLVDGKKLVDLMMDHEVGVTLRPVQDAAIIPSEGVTERELGGGQPLPEPSTSPAQPEKTRKRASSSLSETARTTDSKTSFVQPTNTPSSGGDSEKSSSSALCRMKRFPGSTGPPMKTTSPVSGNSKCSDKTWETVTDDGRLTTNPIAPC